MKLILFNDFQLGVLKGDCVVAVGEAVKDMVYCTPQELMEGVITNFSKLRLRFQKIVDKSEGVPITSVRIRAPLPRPKKIICAIRNYREFGQAAPVPMDAFIKSSEAVIGNGDTVELPPIREVTIFHHEAELAVVIGKPATKVSQAKAMDYVFGYVPFIDVSARGLHPGGRISFYLGKSFDTFAPMGPALVSKDEIPDPHNLDVRLWVSGELRQDYNTSDIAHHIPEFLEFCSAVTTLMPGDVIATGTNHQQLGAIQNGDEVELEISNWGRLAVYVQDKLRRSWPRGIDQEVAAMVRSTR